MRLYSPAHRGLLRPAPTLRQRQCRRGEDWTMAHNTLRDHANSMQYRDDQVRAPPERDVRQDPGEAAPVTVNQQRNRQLPPLRQQSGRVRRESPQYGEGNHMTNSLKRLFILSGMLAGTFGGPALANCDSGSLSGLYATRAQGSLIGVFDSGGVLHPVATPQARRWSGDLRWHWFVRATGRSRQ